MMDNKQIEVVQFDGDALQVMGATREDGWLVLRSGCEALGVDAEAQRKRLVGPDCRAWAITSVMEAVAQDGKIREVFCIHIDTVPMWLATISASRVRPAVRPKLERYQREAARVLAEHFLGPHAAPATNVTDIIDPKTRALISEVASQIVAPILQGQNQLSSDLSVVRTDVSGMKTDMSEVKMKVCTLEKAIEEAQAYRRKRIPASIKRRHEEFARAVMPRCLPCGSALFDVAGRFIGEHHHIEKASNATLEATMPVCPSCNKAFNLKPMPRHFAETYHERMRVWTGPLFARIAKA